MGQASKQRDFSVEKLHSSETPPRPPTLSPQYNSSNLLDSFELRAVTRQLNKAMQGSSISSPTYLNYINSPFYRQRLDCIYRESAKTPRRIVCSIMTGANLSRKVRMRGSRPASRGFVTRLWKKVKQGFLWNKQ